MMSSAASVLLKAVDDRADLVHEAVQRLQPPPFEFGFNIEAREPS